MTDLDREALSKIRSHIGVATSYGRIGPVEGRELIAKLDAVIADCVEPIPMEEGRWWRVIAPDGSLWCETSDEEEAREAVRAGDTLQRLWRLERWRDAER